MITNQKAFQQLVRLWKSKDSLPRGHVSGDISSSCSEICAFGLRKIAWRKLAFLMTGVIG
jgi:hypothetical protein